MARREKRKPNVLRPHFKPPLYLEAIDFSKMAQKQPTAGIILAAGVSARFGRPKQLLKLEGKHLIEWVMDAALKSRLHSIYLVLGFKHQEILQVLEARLQHPKMQVIINNHYQNGLSESLRAGILKIRDTYPSAMFLLGDQPRLDSKTIDHLLEQYWGSDKDICVPVCRGRQGTPTIFSQKFYDQIVTLKGDIGARQLKQAYADLVLEVEVDNPLVFYDIDTAEDLKRLKEKLRDAENSK